jgi:hypothetical protein
LIGSAEAGVATSIESAATLVANDISLRIISALLWGSRGRLGAELMKARPARFA